MLIPAFWTLPVVAAFEELAAGAVDDATEEAAAVLDAEGAGLKDDSGVGVTTEGDAVETAATLRLDELVADGLMYGVGYGVAT